MTILVLGPSTWLPGNRPSIPDRLREALPTGWPSPGSGEMSPLDVRVALANVLNQRGAPAVVMEAEEPKAPRNMTQKFHELVEKHWVEEYYLYWPFGAARAGMDVEIGFLLERMTGANPKLEAHHVTEETVMAEKSHGVVVMASTSAKEARSGERHPTGRPISEVGMTQTEARELRARLASFAREWDDPRMDVYDDQP